MVTDKRQKETIDFIGLGTQKAGTSWIYACLYEHPEICMPFKEIHFFSRERNWKRGVAWYESCFQSCSHDKIKGEFSTSYLYSEVTPERIYRYDPGIKMIACLRNPVERAFSGFRNDIKGNVIPKNTTFEQAISDNPAYIGHGFYYKQLERYFSLFDRKQILILIYEDSKKSPESFIKKIYKFLEVDGSFVPSMLDKTINPSRTPRIVWLDRLIFHIASFLRERGAHKLVWVGKKTGIPTFIRTLNTEKKKKLTIKPETRSRLEEVFSHDVQKLSRLLGRDLSNDWFDYKKIISRSKS